MTDPNTPAGEPGVPTPPEPAAAPTPPAAPVTPPAPSSFTLQDSAGNLIPALQINSTTYMEANLTPGSTLTRYLKGTLGSLSSYSAMVSTTGTIATSMAEKSMLRAVPIRMPRVFRDRFSLALLRTT